MTAAATAAECNTSTVICSLAAIQEDVASLGETNTQVVMGPCSLLPNNHGLFLSLSLLTLSLCAVYVLCTHIYTHVCVRLFTHVCVCLSFSLCLSPVFISVRSSSTGTAWKQPDAVSCAPPACAMQLFPTLSLSWAVSVSVSACIIYYIWHLHLSRPLKALCSLLMFFVTQTPDLLVIPGMWPPVN